MPRRAAICGYVFAFFLLSALTWLVWQYRYEAVGDEPALTLGHTPSDVMRVPFGKLEGGDGKDALRLKADPETPRLEFRWREQPRAKFAHVRMETSCQGVVHGKHNWDDVRITLLWIDANGKLAQDHFPLWAAYGNKDRTHRDIVVPLARQGTLPKIVISNNGRAGEFTLHSFSIQPVAWRAGMFPAVVLLVSTWLGWAAWGIRRWIALKGTALAKITAAASLWVVFGWYSSLPGPWIPWHPLGKPFPISVVPAPAAVPAKPEVPAPAPTPAPAPPPVAGHPPTPPVAAPTPPTPAPAPAPPQVTPPPPPAPQPLPAAADGAPEDIGGGPMRWLLAHLPALKKFAHLAGFAALATLLGLLTGNRRALWPALALALLSEFCQWAFGFGFGWDDILDLVLDAAAVMLGLALWKRLTKHWQKSPIPPETTFSSPP